MSREKIRPYLITKDEEGNFRLTVRETRYSSQGYPLVTAHLAGRSLRDGHGAAGLRASGSRPRPDNSPPNERCLGAVLRRPPHDPDGAACLSMSASRR